MIKFFVFVFFNIEKCIQNEIIRAIDRTMKTHNNRLPLAAMLPSMIGHMCMVPHRIRLQGGKRKKQKTHARNL